MKLKTKKQRYAFLGSLGLVVIMLVAACGGGAATPTPAATPTTSAATPTPAATPTTPPTPTAVGPRRGGTLRLGMVCTVKNFDPLYAGVCDYIMNWPAYSGLVEKDTRPDNLEEIIPALAKSWSVNSEGTEYTFQLREDVSWHDSQPFSAADVEYTFDAIANPPAGQTSIWHTRLQDVTDVQVVGDHTVVLKTGVPSTFLLSVLTAVRIVPKHVHQEQRPFLQSALGTGPFELESFRQDDSGFFLRRNPTYFREGLPYLDAIDYITIRDVTAREAALRAGRLDAQINDLSEGGLKVIREQYPRITPVVFAKLQYAALLFRHGLGKPWDDVRVRQAISLAIDRESLIQAAWPGGGVTGFILEGPWALPEEELLTFPGWGKDNDKNLVEAKRLMEEAGYPNGFKVEILAGTSVRWQDSALMIQQMLKEINIDLSIRGADTGTIGALQRAGDFEFMHRPMVPAFVDPTDIVSFYLTGEVGHGLNYSNPKVDALYERQARTFDLAERKRIVRDMERELTEDLPVIPLTLLGSFQAHWDYVQGWKPYGLWFHPIWRMERIWIDESLKK